MCAANWFIYFQLFYLLADLENENYSLVGCVFVMRSSFPRISTLDLSSQFISLQTRWDENPRSTIVCQWVVNFDEALANICHDFLCAKHYTGIGFNITFWGVTVERLVWHEECCSMQGRKVLENFLRCVFLLRCCGFSVAFPRTMPCSVCNTLNGSESIRSTKINKFSQLKSISDFDIIKWSRKILSLDVKVSSATFSKGE